MNNTSIIVIFLVIVAALGGGAYLYSQNAPTPSVDVPSDSGGAAGTMPEGTEGNWSDTPGVELNAEADASLSANTIHYTDAGFEPVVVGPLAAGKSFDSSQPIFLKAMTARELRAALKLP